MRTSDKLPAECREEAVENEWCTVNGDCPRCDDEPETMPCYGCKWYRGPGREGEQHD